MTPIEAIKGAFKCLAGERVSETVQLGRLAICETCPKGRRWKVLGLKVLQCSECDCLLAAGGEPVCKTTVKGERCPCGNW